MRFDLKGEVMVLNDGFVVNPLSVATRRDFSDFVVVGGLQRHHLSHTLRSRNGSQQSYSTI